MLDKDHTMRIIRKSRLFFQNNGSDKVYEVDLCDLGGNVGEKRYVVNFRYGRRGRALREATKTVSPVNLTEANEIYSSVIASKINKNYQETTTGVQQQVAKTEPSTTKPHGLDSRTVAEAQLMEHLNAARQGALTDDQTKRMIWRIGERRMRQAAEPVAYFAQKQDALLDYCVAWTLGRCGDPSYAPILDQLQKKHGLNHVGRMAREAWFELVDSSAADKVMCALTDNLPSSIVKAIASNDVDRMLSSIELALTGMDAKSMDILCDLYTLSRGNTSLHAAVSRFVRAMPLKPGTFKAVRRIFKQAEFRGDSTLFAISSYRFETEQAGFWHSEYGDHVLERQNHTYVNFRKEIVKENSKLAFSNRTRHFLRRRSWRTLRKLAALDSTAYIRHATDMLLEYSDGDAVPEWDLSWYVSEERRYRVRHFGGYGHFLAFNYILESNSSRVKLTSLRNKWYIDTDVPEKKAFRPEAFPDLWDQHPTQLVKLLSKSACAPVHQFAARALREQKDFCARLAIETIIIFLGKSYPETAELALELARIKINQGDIDLPLLVALINSPSSKARKLAQETIKTDRTWFTKDNELLYRCIISPYEDVRLWVRRIATELELSTGAMQALFGRLIAHVLELAKTENKDTPIIDDIGWILENVLTQYARTLSLFVIEDLLTHAAGSVQALGAALLLGHETPAEQLPASIFQTLLGAASPNVRALGVKLFAQLADETLLKQPDFVVSLAVSKDSEVRHAARPLIVRLAQRNTVFANAALARLINHLFRSEPVDGFHDDILLLVEKEFNHVSNEITKDTTWRLLQAKTKAAKRYGAHVLKRFPPSDYSVRQLARLGGHSISKVREWAWTGLIDDIPRVKENAQDALVLFDNDWQDGRKFAFQFFSEHFSEGDWTPELLISICDSVRPEIQGYGRHLINQHFKEDDAVEYLLKLSEHPSDNLQLFVTNYLRQYASHDFTRLKKLMPYFITILSKVNGARAAKTRVTEFLKQQSGTSYEAAHFVAQIFTRQSATTAMIDKSAAIEILLEIHLKHQDLPTPLIVKEPTVFGRGAGRP